MERKNLVLLICFGFLVIPFLSNSQEINQKGWPVPDIKGLSPYSITIQSVDGVEKIVEKFYTSSGGHIARVSGNNKIFGYAVDADRIPPIDYFLIDPDGLGKFTLKYKSDDLYLIPGWVFH